MNLIINICQVVIGDKRNLFSEVEIENLKMAILKLPEDQQTVLDLHYIQRLSIKTIATELQCSVTTTYSKLNKALFTLKNEFNPSVYERMYSILYPGTGRPTLPVITAS